MTASALESCSDGWYLQVRLMPNAGRDAIEECAADAAGRIQLKARVTAVPEKGKANKALISMLAKAAGLPKSSFKIASGDKDRNKKLFIADPDGAFKDRLVRLLIRE